MSEPRRQGEDAPDNIDSHGSSPVMGGIDMHQADQDKYLAESMSTSVRARSNTFLDRDRDRSAQVAAAVTSPSSPPREGVSASASKRRGSSGVTGTAMDHLADDLHIDDAQQDYYDHQQQQQSSRSPRQAGSMHQQTPARPMASSSSPAAARFYRQHRNMSESSLASEGGAFIDHRRQPHYIPSAKSYTKTGLRRQTAENSNNDGGASSSDDAEDEYRGSPHQAASPLRRPDDPSTSGISNRTLRVSPGDLPEHAISDSGSPRSPSQMPDMGPRASFHSHDGAEIHPGEFSRRGSFRQAEEDVCFPAHGPEPNLLDQMYTEQAAHHVGAPGLLHGYQFPFDFEALEEYADREREGLPIPGAKKSRGGAHDGTSPPGYGSSGGDQHVNFGTSVSGAGEGGGLRARVRQRKLSESVAPGGRFKKLALFEGGDDDSSGRRDSSKPSYTTILDTKTPLLGNRAQSYGATSGGPSSGQARPYRFSFYSNALPSTIHARSLAELPAEGQTFEDLFLGRQGGQDDSPSQNAGHQQDEPQIQFSPPPRSTGTQTPSAQFRAPSSKRSSINNGARGGLGMPGLNMSNGGGDPGKTLRKEFTRSDADLEANTWWLDVMCPTDQEMKVLSKVFGIHPLTTEDIQMEETREKIELFRNYYFVCFRSFEQDPYSPTYLEPLNMYIIVFREGTLSFHFRGTPHPQNVRRRIKQLKDYINVTSDWISYALIDDITDAFGPLIQNIEYEVDSIDELVLILKEAEQSDMLRRIGTCRKKVMGLLRLMGNKADVVKGLSKRCNENWSVAPKSDIGLYLSDIQDHITTSTQNLTHYEKILSRSHSNYLAQISIEMTDANNQINDVLSKLTALGTVLIPMNLVTGLWGMNVHVPGQDVDNLHWFFGIIGSLAAIAIVGLYFTYKIFVRQ